MRSKNNSWRVGSPLLASGMGNPGHVLWHEQRKDIPRAVDHVYRRAGIQISGQLRN
jgi:hypothetical protein